MKPESATCAEPPAGAGKRLESVVIVGNGASLLGGGNGAWIDGHDVVVRFNLFQTERFEEDVGRRTTIWFNNRDAESPQIQKRLQRPDLERIYVHTWVGIAEATRSFQTQLERSQLSTPVIAVDHGDIKEMTAYLGERYHMFSTGAIGVWLLLQEFASVDLIGFDWWQPSERFHYCDNTKFVHTPQKGHQPELEKRFFEKLEKEKRLRFHVPRHPAQSPVMNNHVPTKPAAGQGAPYTGSEEEWRQVHQPWELRYHQGANFRWPQWQQKWDAQWRDVFAFAGMEPAFFQEEDVLLDVGCGSRPVLDYFSRGRKFFLDPLLASYTKIPQMEPFWSRHEAANRFAQPAEEPVAALVGQCDFVLCWNVLDHSYDPFQIVRHLHAYVRPGGKILLGTDLREQAHIGHPGIRNRGEFLRLIEKHFTIRKKVMRNAFPSCLDIALLLERA